MSQFSRFVDDHVREQGTATKLAEMLGMSVSGFTRGVKRNTLGIENLLRLAEALGEPPLHVLRIADKADIAALLERLFGAPTVPLSAVDRTLIELDTDVKTELVRLVHRLQSAARKR